MRSDRRPREAEEEETAYVSMTDLTVGFLFVVMLMMAYFATQFSSADNVPRALYEETLAERDRLERKLADAETHLERMRAELDRARARINELERLRAEADAARQALAERLAAIEGELAALRISLAASQTEAERLRSEAAVAKARVAELERQLSQLGVRNPLEAYLSQAAAERRRVLEQIRASLTVPPGLLVEITDEGDALRFTGAGMFRSDSAELSAEARRVVADLGTLLDQAIGCYTFGQTPRPPNCPDAPYAIETILIEGHTDTVGGEEKNRQLSTNRANTAFRVMTDAAPFLRSRENLRGQPVLGLAGYGEMRLAVSTADNVEEPANRRIDIRILMQTPATVAEIETIRQRLQEER